MGLFSEGLIIGKAYYQTFTVYDKQFKTIFEHLSI